MKFEEWFSYYQQIRSQFKYSTERDQNSANYLSQIIKRKSIDLAILKKKIFNKSVIVIGSSPNLQEKIKFIKKNKKFTKIVADSAVKTILENNIQPDIVVTDLDGDKSSLIKSSTQGAIMVVHAHGDNYENLQKIVPKLKNIIGSTQVVPLYNVYNFGGFTDGDRSVFLAEELGAKEIILVGMEFGNKIGQYSMTTEDDVRIKIEKLKIGRKLLQMLAKRTSTKLFDTSDNPISGFMPYVDNS